MQNQTHTQQYQPLNFFDSLDSKDFYKRIAEFNTQACIKILSSENQIKWTESIIECTLKDTHDEAKQIYEIAKSIRVEYIEVAVSDLERLSESVNKNQLSDLKDGPNAVIEYLFACIFQIDLFDVAKELLARYKKQLSTKKK